MTTAIRVTEARLPRGLASCISRHGEVPGNRRHALIVASVAIARAREVILQAQAWEAGERTSEILREQIVRSWASAVSWLVMAEEYRERARAERRPGVAGYHAGVGGHMTYALPAAEDGGTAAGATIDLGPIKGGAGTLVVDGERIALGEGEVATFVATQLREPTRDARGVVIDTGLRWVRQS